MANTFVQFGAEESALIKAARICEKPGIDLPTCLRMCVSRSIPENGIPFSMKINDPDESNALKAMKNQTLSSCLFCCQAETNARYHI